MATEIKRNTGWKDFNIIGNSGVRNKKNMVYM